MKDVPEWIKDPTPYSDDLTVSGLLLQLNFLKGAYVGHKEEIAELEEMVELARAYERERIAQYFEGRAMTATAKLARGSEDR